MQIVENAGWGCRGYEYVAAAHHAGMAVLCLSLITNKVVMHDDPTMEHANH